MLQENEGTISTQDQPTGSAKCRSFDRVLPLPRRDRSHQRPVSRPLLRFIGLLPWLNKRNSRSFSLGTLQSQECRNPGRQFE
jgi:hypothetical protein